MLVGPVSNAVVQIGEDGVLVVDTMMEQNADAMVAEIKRLAPNKIIRYVVNTHVHLDHTGGNEKVAAAGRTLVAGNFAGQVAADSPATIIAHENVLNRMSAPTGKQSSRPTAAWPNDSFFDDQKDLFFNGEGVELIHIPSAHTDGDLMVYFRKSDVLAAGDLYVNNTFPIVMTAEGGSYNGILTALNKIIDICIPRDKEEGGTFVVPGHGRLADEADVVDYRDMATVIHDRFADAIKKGMTLEQVKNAKLVQDYGRWASNTGFWTTDKFVDAVYESMKPKPGAAPSGGRGAAPAAAPKAPAAAAKPTGGKK
jgi:glyoxylase-like metal-dependent hydrolase (beta-lactamase superfamily II)